MNNSEGSENKEPDRNLALSVSTVQELWTKTYNPEGKPDWSHILPYYSPNIIFRDSIQKIEGIHEFEKMCRRLTNRCSKLVMDIHNIAQKNDIIVMEWTMTMIFRRLPNTSIQGCTRLSIGEDGRIIEQRDYYDLWGDIFDRVPVTRAIYRKFMRLFFG